MKKSIFFILAALFLFINCLPSSIVFADDSGYTDTQLANIGTLMLSSMISSGEATELDFSDYSENDGFDFLLALGELAVTGDPSGLIDQGLSWLGDELDDAYQSLIEDIRAWEHDVAPDLYNWWYNGTQYEYKLQPTNNISRPLTNLLRHPNNNIVPNPDPNLSFVSNCASYIARWNNLGDIDFSSVPYYQNSKDAYGRNYCSKFLPYSIFSVEDILITTELNRHLYYYDVGTVYLTTNQDNTVSAQYLFSNKTTFHCDYYNLNFNSADYFRYNTGGYIIMYTPNLQTSIYPFQNTFNGISTACNYLYQHFRHINIYVDGVPWALTNDNTPTYPIVIPDMLTVLNNQPAQYTFSEPTYIDLSGLTTLITNAINSSDIVTWQDIDDYFIDVNGVQALPTINIIRNDYDNMYIEQYPYPAKLIGMQDPLTFNEHMFDNYYGQYLTPMVNVASNTIDVLPNEIKWVLGIGSILMIFAVIINRLLE